MGIEAYRVRASRLARHLESALGINIELNEAHRAVAAEEGIPRADWNILAARAKNEPVENDSELLIGQSGSGKSEYARTEIVKAAAVGRSILIISTLGDYDKLFELLAGAMDSALHTVNRDGSIDVTTTGPGNGGQKVVFLKCNSLVMQRPKFVTSLKELGFSRPQAREMLVVADEIHQFEQFPWLVEMLQQIAEHECATALVISQFAQDGLRPALAARVRKARIFRCNEAMLSDGFMKDTVTAAGAMRLGESIVRRIRIFGGVPDGALEPTALKLTVREDVPQKSGSLLQSGRMSVSREIGELRLRVSSGTTDEELDAAIDYLLCQRAMPVRVVSVDGHDVASRPAWPKIKAKLLSSGREVMMGTPAEVEMLETSKSVIVLQEPSGKVHILVSRDASDESLLSTTASRWVSDRGALSITILGNGGHEVTKRKCWPEIQKRLLDAGHEVVTHQPGPAAERETA